MRRKHHLIVRGITHPSPECFASPNQGSRPSRHHGLVPTPLSHSRAEHVFVLYSMHVMCT